MANDAQSPATKTLAQVIERSQQESIVDKAAAPNSGNTHRRSRSSSDEADEISRSKRRRQTIKVSRSFPVNGDIVVLRTKLLARGNRVYLYSEASSTGRVLFGGGRHP